MAQGTITLYEGKGKDSGKPFTALKLEVGKWNVLYFPKSPFEMDYIKEQLAKPTLDTTDADDLNLKKGIFN